MTHDEAKQFIFTRTGEPPDIIQRFLERRFRYKELNGVAEPTDDIAEERQQHHDILLLNGCEAPYMVVEYVRRTTDLEVRRIANILAEEMGYMESRGMVDWGVYACYRGWADDVIQAEDAGTKARTHQLRLVKS